ncbi:MAG: metal ABC transporter ATP-binding protein [Desulfovibrionales bacterium]
MTTQDHDLHIELGRADPAVSLCDVSFSYDTVPVLENVDFEVKPGEFVAVLGPNGGGKTTLAKLMLGLLKPDRGDVHILGKAPQAVLPRVGYVPQQSMIGSDFPANVLDIVLTGLVSSKTLGWWHSRADKDRAREALDRVGMLDQEGARFGDLSGGQKQRVLIARSLVSDPMLLILDEPTSSIDPQAKFCFYHFLEGLRKEVTIVAVSHDMAIMASGLTSVACVNRRLIHNQGAELTPEMVALLYGTHDAKSCPAGEFFTNNPGLLLRTGRGGGK